MPEDWNTKNVKGATQSGEIATLRAKYIKHRDALSRMATDAPTHQIGQAYLRLRSEIESALGKLNEIETQGHISGVFSDLPPGADDSFSTMAHRPEVNSEQVVEPAVRSGPRLALLGIIALAGVLLFAYFIYRYATTEDRARIVEGRSNASGQVANTTAPPTTPAPSPTPTLAIDASSFDFGDVARGTRKAKSFELTNHTNSAVQVKVARSECRCLWFTHPPTIAPRSKGTLTVTIDGSRAKPGEVSEAVRVSAQHDPKVTAAILITGKVN